MAINDPVGDAVLARMIARMAQDKKFNEATKPKAWKRNLHWKKRRDLTKKKETRKDLK